MATPYDSRGRNVKNYQSTHKLRKNERIKVPKVRVIGPDGSQLGVMETIKAIQMAKSHELDLVEVSATAIPPVCRIVDFGKYMYEEKKKAKSSKPTIAKLKETKFRVNIDEHDYLIKIRQTEGFLARGNKVKLTLMFRGRELAHKDRGFDIIKRAIKDLEKIGSPDAASPKLAGKSISSTMSPLPVNQRKLVFNASIEDHVDESESEEE